VNTLLTRLVDSGRVPDSVLRIAIRAICAQRLRDQRGDVAEEQRRHQALVEELRHSEIAIETAAANAQHYEVPAAFFARVLGPHKKYSSCLWSPGTTSLADAEHAMLALTAERAGIADDQDVLDLGCGWGSFSLWAAPRFPRSRFVAVSNSHAQRAAIEASARERGIANLTVRTADVRTIDLGRGAFDRVVSVEMFEHMRNYRALLANIATWLRPSGALFVHVFAHRRFAYPFEDRGASDWMAREFFTGGIMPSAQLLHAFQDHLAIVDEWHLDGTHYAKTAEAWLANLDAARDEMTALLGSRAQVERWRVFFLACAELFGFRGGREWIVAHYRFAGRSGS